MGKFSGEYPGRPEGSPGSPVSPSPVNGTGKGRTIPDPMSTGGGAIASPPVQGFPVVPALIGITVIGGIFFFLKRRR